MPAYRLTGSWIKLGRLSCPRCNEPAIIRARKVIGFCSTKYEIYADHGRNRPRWHYLTINDEPVYEGLPDLTAPTREEAEE